MNFAAPPVRAPRIVRLIESTPAGGAEEESLIRFYGFNAVMPGAVTPSQVSSSSVAGSGPLLFSDAFVSKLVPVSSVPAAAPARSVSVQVAANSPVMPFNAGLSTASSAIAARDSSSSALSSLLAGRRPVPNDGWGVSPSSQGSLSKRRDRARD